jgi:hypothetical protein
MNFKILNCTVLAPVKIKVCFDAILRFHLTHFIRWLVCIYDDYFSQGIEMKLHFKWDDDQNFCF